MYICFVIYFIINILKVILRERTFEVQDQQRINLKWKHNRSLKVAVQGSNFMAHPLYIHTREGTRLQYIQFCEI
jgi:hypothetical protein